MTDLTDVGAAATATVPDVDYKGLIRKSRRPERTVPICLRGDLVAEFEELDAKLAALTTDRPADSRLNSGPVAEAKRIALAMADLQEQMRASTVTFRLRALKPSRWAELRAEHPPRQGEDGKVLDEDTMGINSATFFEPLIRESVVSPVLDDDDWKILLNSDEDGAGQAAEDEGARGLSDQQLDLLGGAAWSVNRRGVDIPFSRAASRMTRPSEPD